MDLEGGATGTQPPPKKNWLTVFFYPIVGPGPRPYGTSGFALVMCAHTHSFAPPPPPQWKSWIRPCTWISSSTFVGQTNYLYVWNDAQAMNGHLIAKLLLVVKKICFTFLITLSPNFKMVSSDLLSVCPPRHLQTPNSAFKAHVSNPHVPQISPTRRDCEADWIQACAPSANYPNISSSIFVPNRWIIFFSLKLLDIFFFYISFTTLKGHVLMIKDMTWNDGWAMFIDLCSDNTVRYSYLDVRSE